MTALDHTKAVLRYLYGRIATGDEDFCSAEDIKKDGLLTAANVQEVIDELAKEGLINYSMFGSSFQISQKGFKVIEGLYRETPTNSAEWTGVYEISPHSKAKVIGLLSQIAKGIEDSSLPNAEKANALALVESARVLAEAPDPPWSIIVRIINEPVLGNIVGIASLLLAVVALMVGA